MTPDIVANAIVAALSTGAIAGATDTAKSAIADAYQGLKSLIKKKFGNDSDAAEAIDKLEAKPDSDGRKQTLAEELKAVNSNSDPELVCAAQSLLDRHRSSRPWQLGACHVDRRRGDRVMTPARWSIALTLM